MAEARRHRSRNAIATRHALNPPPAASTASARSPRRSPRSARACPAASSSAPPDAAPRGAGATTTPPSSTAPTPSWIRKVGSRTITRALSQPQLERYRPLFEPGHLVRGRSQSTILAAPTRCLPAYTGGGRARRRRWLSGPSAPPANYQQTIFDATQSDFEKPSLTYSRTLVAPTGFEPALPP